MDLPTDVTRADGILQSRIQPRRENAPGDNWWREYSKADMKSVTESFHTQTILAASIFMSQIQKEGLFELYAICERKSAQADPGKLEAFKQCEATC